MKVGSWSFLEAKVKVLVLNLPLRAIRLKLKILASTWALILFMLAVLREKISFVS